MHSKFAIKLLKFFFVAIFLFFLWQVYAPYSLAKKTESIYIMQKGSGYKNISWDLKKEGIIRSDIFFKIYVLISGNYGKLQAGNYFLSPSMSVSKIVKKFSSGDVIKNYITIIEGWNLDDIGNYFEGKEISSKKDFLNATKQDFSKDFYFLKDKPKNLSLEGYIFPDTYEILLENKPEEILKNILANFDKKITPEIRKEINLQGKSLFEIITMASIIEKEVSILEDKKIVSGILWKRIVAGIPLQVDATVNYATGKNDKRVAIKDTGIDSPYNTYKYYGLPKGPISNPGMESIIAAIYPSKSDYWYYLSADKTGQTIFSETLENHNEAVAKYLK